MEPGMRDQDLGGATWMEAEFAWRRCEYLTQQGWEPHGGAQPGLQTLGHHWSEATLALVLV